MTAIRQFLSTLRGGLAWPSGRDDRIVLAAHIGLAAALMLNAAAIVFEFRLGPVVMVISESHRMGVHLGDAWAVLPAALAVVVLVRGLALMSQTEEVP